MKEMIENKDNLKTGGPQLGSFLPRDTTRVVAQSLAYSRAVGYLRWALPLVVLLVLVTIMIWPMVRARTFKSILANNIPNLVIEDLNLTGLDSKNQAYSLTATKAFQSGNSKDLIDLEKPEGDMMLNSGAWLAGKAHQGRLNQKTQRLWLSGGVELFHDQGYAFSTNEAQVNLDNNTAWGDKPVLIQGSFGEIRGQGFRLLERGNVVVIEGQAKAKLNLQSSQSSDRSEKTKTTQPGTPEKGQL